MGWIRLENWPVTWIGLVPGLVVLGWFRLWWFWVGSGFGGSWLDPGWKIDLQPGLGWFRVGKFQPIATSNRNSFYSQSYRTVRISEGLL